MLLRAKAVHGRDEVFTPVDNTLHHFTPHVESDCKLCHPADSNSVLKRAGRPKKGAPGPGKYARVSHSPVRDTVQCVTEDKTNLELMKSSFTKLSDNHRKEFLKFLVDELNNEELEIGSGLLGERSETNDKSTI